MKKHLLRGLSKCKVSTLLLAMVCLSAQLIHGQSGLVLEKVVAQTGVEDIFYSEVQELYGYAKAQNPAYDASLQCDILEQLIVKGLLIDQAELDSIVVSDVEVEAQVQQRIDYILSQMGGDEQRFFQYYGQTPTEKAREMREPLKEEILQQRIQSQLINGVEITPKEVVAFFENIPADSLPYLPAEVEIGEITTKTLISDKMKQAARDKLEKVRDRIVNGGESFEELAPVFSDDPGSAGNGGDLGWAKRGTYVSEFEATAYNLEKGEISEIIETQFGFHFLQLIDRRGNNIHLRHILIKPEVTPEDVAATQSFLDSVKTLISEDSMSFDMAVKLFSDEDAQSYSNAGRMSNPETGDTFWETGQLPYQIYFAIEEVDVGGLSDIIELEERGEKVFKVIKLMGKTKPHRASLETDFAKIKQYAKESKKNIYFNNWMEEKISSTYIKISPEFKSCPNLVKFQGDLEP